MGRGNVACQSIRGEIELRGPDHLAGAAVTDGAVDFEQVMLRERRR